MSSTLVLALLGLTALLGLSLTACVLRDVPSPTWLRRAHLLAGATALAALLRAVAAAASATPRPPGPTGQLPAGFVVCAFLLGLSIWAVARYAKAGLTVVRALHMCMGFCGVLLAAAWILRPGA